MNKFIRYIFDRPLIYRTDFSFIHLCVTDFCSRPIMAVQCAECDHSSRDHMVWDLREEDNLKVLREGSKQASTKGHYISLTEPNTRVAEILISSS